MRNEAIRNHARKKRVYLWRIADQLGIADFAFSKLLRHELPAEKQAEIMRIIDALAEEEN